MRPTAVAVLLALACGGTSADEGNTGASASVAAAATWTLQPQQANLYNGGSFRLWFTVTSAPQPSDYAIPAGVTLSVVEANGGTISGDTYTAPAAPAAGTFHVQATDGTTTLTCTVIVSTYPSGA